MTRDLLELRACIGPLLIGEAVGVSGGQPERDSGAACLLISPCVLGGLTAVVDT
jgi:hypothetical protein